MTGSISTGWSSRDCSTEVAAVAIGLGIATVVHLDELVYGIVPGRTV